MRDEDKPRVALAQAVRELRENIAAHVELSQLQARITRAKYLALLKEGFSEADALMLCR
jgi:hypothetical protein